ELEAAREAAVRVVLRRAPADYRARRHGDRPVAPAPEDLGQRRDPLRDPHPAPRLAQEDGRPARGQDRVDRRKRAGRLAPRLLEEDPFARERREARRRLLAVAIGREVIRPQRVEQDEDDVEGSLPFLLRRAASEPGASEAERGEESEASHGAADRSRPAPRSESLRHPARIVRAIAHTIPPFREKEPRCASPSARTTPASATRKRSSGTCWPSATRSPTSARIPKSRSTTPSSSGPSPWRSRAATSSAASCSAARATARRWRRTG